MRYLERFEKDLVHKSEDYQAKGGDCIWVFGVLEPSGVLGHEVDEDQKRYRFQHQENHVYVVCHCFHILHFI